MFTYNSVETISVDVNRLDHVEPSLLGRVEHGLGTIGEAESADSTGAERSED